MTTEERMRLSECSMAINMEFNKRRNEASMGNNKQKVPVTLRTVSKGIEKQDVKLDLDAYYDLRLEGNVYHMSTDEKIHTFKRLQELYDSAGEKLDIIHVLYKRV